MYTTLSFLENKQNKNAIAFLITVVSLRSIILNYIAAVSHLLLLPKFEAFFNYLYIGKGELLESCLLQNKGTLSTYYVCMNENNSDSIPSYFFKNGGSL